MSRRWLAAAAVVIVAVAAALVVLIGGGDTPRTRAAATTDPFTFTPTDPKPGDLVEFTASVRCQLDDECTYAWYDDGGNGPGDDDVLLAEGTSPTFSRVFPESGTQHIRLTVTSSGGKDLVVAAPGEPTPTPESSPTPAPTPSPSGPPTAPTGLSGTFSGGTVRLDWEDNREPDILFYAVRWSTDRLKPLDQWTRLPEDWKTSEATQASPPANTIVYYYVTAVDDQNGNGVFDKSVDNVSPRSEQASVSTAPPPPSPTPTATPSATPTATPVPATPTPTPTPGPSAGNPLWAEDFDDGNAAGFYQLLAPTQGTRVFFDTAVKEQGSTSMRMELRSGDTANSDGKNRNQYRAINVPGSTAHYFTEGQDRYFRFAVYVDPSMTVGASFSNPWRTLVAWPSVQDGAFSPLKYMLQRTTTSGAAAPTGTDSLILSGDLGVSGGNDVAQWQTPVEKGRWYDFITHWRFSSSPTTGLVEHWMRREGEQAFTKQTFKNGQQTMRLKTLSAAGATSNLRVGLYRNPLFTTVDSVHFDDFAMGDSLAAVGAAG